MVTLLFTGLILSFVVLDIFVIRRWERRASLVNGGAGAHGAPRLRDVILPRSYFFHPGHTWARIEETGEVTVGADDLLQTVLGRIDAIYPPTPGARVDADALVCRLGQGQSDIELAAPLSGRVTAFNAAAVACPGLVNSDPYGDGWLFRIEPDQGPVKELSRLAIGRRAAEWMTTEIDRVQELASLHSPHGSAEALLETCGEPVWRAFQERFPIRQTERVA